MWVRGLPVTELQREYDATASVTLEHVLGAARKHVKPDSAGLLLVGDRAKIEPGLRELKLREIVLLDAEGNVLKNAGAGTGSSR